MNIDSGDARLVLLCPAWKKWGNSQEKRNKVRSVGAVQLATRDHAIR
jgi:hypothetical protein